MQIQIVSVLSMAAAASALSVPAILSKRAPCDAPSTVQFHFNDTTLGTVESCSTDVTNRGGETVTRRQYDTACIDGPTTNYTVEADNTLECIAAKFNSGVCNIAEANDLANPDFILLGQVLIVPTNVCSPDNESCRTSAGTATCVTPGPGVEDTHTIISGDTFFLIAADLGITLDSLVAANPGVDASNLQIDQVINIPICAE